MMADECLEMGAKSPGSRGGSPVMRHAYLEGVDEVAERAVAAGAEVVRLLQASSTESGPASSRIPSDIPGMSPPTSRTLRRKNSNVALRRWVKAGIPSP